MIKLNQQSSLHLRLAVQSADDLSASTQGAIFSSRWCHKEYNFSIGSLRFVIKSHLLVHSVQNFLLLL